MKTVRPRQLLLLLALCLALLTLRPVKDDLWIHLLVGEQIATTWTIPAQDIFSYAEHERPWVAHLWLSRLATNLIHQTAGLQGVRLAYALLALGFALSVAYFYRRMGYGYGLAALGMVLAMVLSADRFRMRPHLFTMSFLYVGLALVHTYWNQLEKRHILGLAAFTSLWVNLHSGGLLFPLLVGAWWVGEVVQIRWQQGRWVWEGRKMAAVAAVWAGSVVTPYHFSLWIYIFEYKPILQYVPEYAPSWKFLGMTGRTPLGLAPAITTAAVAWAALRRRLSLSEVLVSLPILYLGWRHARFLYMLPIPLAWSVREVGVSLSSSQLKRVTAVLLVVLADYFATLRGPDLLATLQRPDQMVSARHFPVEATEYLLCRHARGRIYSYTLWNTYLLYHLYPHCQTFFDTRHIYGSLKTFREAYVMGEGMEEQGKLFDRYQVDILVVKKGFRFVRGEARRWKRVFHTDDGREIVFVRRGSGAVGGT